jgi:hypothetical protein
LNRYVLSDAVVTVIPCLLQASADDKFADYKPTTAFFFPGQGAQSVGMAKVRNIIKAQQQHWHILLRHTAPVQTFQLTCFYMPVISTHVPAVAAAGDVHTYQGMSYQRCSGVQPA